MNTAKPQIWIAIGVYVLVALVKTKLETNRSLYEILQVLRISLFEKTPALEALTATYEQSEKSKALNNCRCSTSNWNVVINPLIIFATASAKTLCRVL